MTNKTSPIILAFSGGLDTSFCVPWLKETYRRDVVTATIDTGGIDAEAVTALHERAMALGARDATMLRRDATLPSLGEPDISMPLRFVMLRSALIR